jgi:hypothetical protein
MWRNLVTRPKPPPIESFGPELIAALTEGAKARFEVPLPYNSAVKFRQRIYSLRNAMRLSGHPHYFAVSRTRVQIIWPKETPIHRSSKGVTWPRDPQALCLLVISPYDSEFADALAKSGIKPQDLDSDPLDAFSGIPAALKNYSPGDNDL